jgi:hypothetical protein
MFKSDDFDIDILETSRTTTPSHKPNCLLLSLRFTMGGPNLEVFKVSPDDYPEKWSEL